MSRHVTLAASLSICTIPPSRLQSTTTILGFDKGIAMKVAPSSSGVSALKALQCKVFGTTYNPTQARTGAKVLRQRLQGPSMLAYYPPTVNLRAIEKLAPGLGRLKDVREIQREKDVERKKMLGKGPPKKGKSAPRSHRINGNRTDLAISSCVRRVDRRGTTCGNEGQAQVATFAFLTTKLYFYASHTTHQHRCTIHRSCLSTNHPASERPGANLIGTIRICCIGLRCDEG